MKCDMCKLSIANGLSIKAGRCATCRKKTYVKCAVCGLHSMPPKSGAGILRYDPCINCPAQAIPIASMPSPVKATTLWKCINCNTTSTWASLQFKLTKLCGVCRAKMNFNTCNACGYDVIVNPTTNVCVYCISPKKVSSSKPTTQVKPDTNEWKLWRDSSIEKGNCVCGIPKSSGLCKYH
jgi:hypothetical protein